MQEEIWKDVPNYEGYYQVSNLGRVKSLKRIVFHSLYGSMNIKEKILRNGCDSGGYKFVVLNKNKISKTINIHKIVSMTFMNHIPNGHINVINHKNFIKTDNRVDNLEIISQRENTNKKHKIHSSIYTGVSWCKKYSKWNAQIYIKPKFINIGYFENEYDAHLAYEKELHKIIYGQ